MTLPTFGATGTVFASSGSAGSPGMPAGLADGDVLLLIAESPSLQSYDAIADWPNVFAAQDATGTTGTRLTVKWKRWHTGDTLVPPTVSGPSNHLFAVIASFPGCIPTGNPWDVTSVGSESVEDTSFVIPGATTTVPDCLVVVVGTHGIDTALDRWPALVTNADLANITKRLGTSTNAGNGGGIGIFTGEKAAAGAYAASTGDLAAASAKAFATIALKPPVGGSLNLSGSITPTADVRRDTIRLPSGLFAPAGATRRDATRNPSGSTSPAGSPLRGVADQYAGSTAPAGAPVRAAGKALTGSATPSGAVTATKSLFVALGGLLAPVGALVRRVTVGRAGQVAPVGDTTRRASIEQTGSTTPDGTAVRDAGRLLEGATAPTGATSLGSTAVEVLRRVLRFAARRWPLGLAARRRRLALATKRHRRRLGP